MKTFKFDNGGELVLISRKTIIGHNVPLIGSRLVASGDTTDLSVVDWFRVVSFEDTKDEKEKD